MGNRATLEDRRNKGWRKVATILGLLGEVESRHHRIEVGLHLRRAILTSCLFLPAEAWSAMTDAEIHRLEQVDFALSKDLVRGHLRTALVFHPLKTGT